MSVNLTLDMTTLPSGVSYGVSILDNPSGLLSIAYIDTSGSVNIIPENVTGTSEWVLPSLVLYDDNRTTAIDVSGFASTQYLSLDGFSVDSDQSLTDFRFAVKAMWSETAPSGTAHIYFSDSYSASPSGLQITKDTIAVDDGTSGGKWYYLEIGDTLTAAELASYKLYIQGDDTNTDTNDPPSKFYVSRVQLQATSVTRSFETQNGLFISGWIDAGASTTWEKIVATDVGDGGVYSLAGMFADSEAEQDSQEWINLDETETNKNLFHTARYFKYQIQIQVIDNKVPMIDSLNITSIDNPEPVYLTISDVALVNNKVRLTIDASGSQSCYFAFAHASGFYQTDPDADTGSLDAYRPGCGITTFDNFHYIAISGVQEFTAPSGQYTLDIDVSGIHDNAEYQYFVAAYRGSEWDYAPVVSGIVNIFAPEIYLASPYGTNISYVDNPPTDFMSTLAIASGVVYEPDFEGSTPTLQFIPDSIRVGIKAHNKNVNMEQSQFRIAYCPLDGEEYSYLDTGTILLNTKDQVTDEDDGLGIFTYIPETLLDGYYYVLYKAKDVAKTDYEALTADFNGFVFSINSEIELIGKGHYRAINLAWSPDRSISNPVYNVYRAKVRIINGIPVLGTYTLLTSTSDLFYSDNSAILNATDDILFRYFIETENKESNTIDMQLSKISNQWVPSVHSGYFYTVDTEATATIGTIRAIPETAVILAYNSSE